MSNDERQARALGRWLDGPADAAPPEDVDADVVEAVYALRPDLAPPPRVTTEEILALVTKGPLAGEDAQAPVDGDRAGEVVPFPIQRVAAPLAEDEAPPEPTRGRRGRFWTLTGGAGGIGLALVAAATLLLVAVPTLKQQEEAAQSAGAPIPISQGISSRSPAAQTATPVADAEAPPNAPAQTSEPQRVAAAPAAKTAPAPAAARPRAEAEPEPETREMASGRLSASRRAAIPEVEAEDDAVAVADGQEAPLYDQRVATGSEAAAPPPSVPAAAAQTDAQPAMDPAAVRTQAVPRDRDPSSWRADTDADTLAAIDRAIEAANTLRRRGDRRGAGDALAAAVQPPERAGQHVAALAVVDYLAAGDARAAAGIAQRGLSLGSSNTPERSWLLVLYGDALSGQDRPGAALDAYEQASELNVAR